VSRLRIANALMLHVAHGIAWRWSISLAAPAIAGSATIASGRSSGSSLEVGDLPGHRLDEHLAHVEAELRQPVRLRPLGELHAQLGDVAVGCVHVRVEAGAGGLHRVAVRGAGVPGDLVSARGELAGERDERPDVAGGGHRGEEEAAHARTLADAAVRRIGDPPVRDGGEGNRTPTSALQRPRAPITTTPPLRLKA
jgi:hypothetical protein